MSISRSFARAASATPGRFVRATLLVVMVLGPGAFRADEAFAVEASEMLADPALEARARAFSAEFRCLVCQNESIDESNASLAHDLRALIREQVKAGKSNAEIRDFLVARYGQFVLLRPRFEWETLLLWLGPFLILAAGALVIGVAAKRRGGFVDAPLSAEEKTRLARLGVAADAPEGH
jgi:cytochrome c-type biogenesis protein CcmH